MFKRRPLNKDQDGNKPQGNDSPNGNSNNHNGNAANNIGRSGSGGPTTPQGNAQAPGGGSGGGSNQSRSRNRNRRRGRNKRGGGNGQNQGPNQNQQQQQGRGQQGQQGQRSGQRQGQDRNQQRNQQRNQRRQPPPPAFLQRDVLLILNKETSKPIEDVRAKFDPLAKKLPAHLTVLYSEPSSKIQNDILKNVKIGDLPAIKSLTFNSIQVIDDMYLWLVPDEESTHKLKVWHEEFRKTLADTHTQGEPYEPHLTLGYVPRKLPEEEALAFAKNLISMPLTVKVDTVLLEEFSEDQNSRSVDRLSVLV